MGAGGVTLSAARHDRSPHLEKAMQLIVKTPSERFFFLPAYQKCYDSYESNSVINSKQPTAVIYPTFSMHFSLKCVILTTPDF